MKDPGLKLDSGVRHHKESWSIDTSWGKDEEGRLEGYGSEVCPQEGWVMLHTLRRPRGRRREGSGVRMSDVVMFRRWITFEGLRYLPSLFSQC